MRLLSEIKTWLKVAGESITTHSDTPAPGMRFTSNFYVRAKEWGLSEKDAEDVYYHGETDRWNKRKMRKMYNGYEIGIYYFLDNQTGRPVISSIWKK